MTNINEPLISQLSGFALLAVEGNDRHSFLHSQFINDLNLIEKPGTQLSAWCNPKGQVITDFLIINTGISYLLLCKEDLKEFVQQRLGMFILRADVSINDISNTSPLIGLANITDLSHFGLDQLLKPGETQAIDGLIISCLPDHSERYLITGNSEILENKITQLKAINQITDGAVWELLDILSGLPWITSTTQEKFLPQMLNLDVLNGLSYQKGCYPGQEVIARLHYKGSVKKRITLIKSKQSLQAGDNIYLYQSDNSVGTIVNAAKHPDEDTYALAVIELDRLNEKLITKRQPETEIKTHKLPYVINS